MMRTMSLYETGDSNGAVSLLDLKNGKFSQAISKKDINDYAYYVCSRILRLLFSLRKYNCCVTEAIESSTLIRLKVRDAPTFQALLYSCFCISHLCSDHR